VYNTMNHWESGFGSSSGILNDYEHNISETTPVSVFRCRGETPTYLGKENVKLSP
jgi:hypothetical protein